VGRRKEGGKLGERKRNPSWSDAGETPLAYLRGIGSLLWGGGRVKKKRWCLFQSIVWVLVACRWSAHRDLPTVIEKITGHGGFQKSTEIVTWPEASVRVQKKESGNSGW